METCTFTVSTEYVGKRLDRFLDTFCEGHSRSLIQKCIENGFVTIDGTVVAKASRKLKAGLVVTIAFPPPEPLNAVPEDLPLAILYEDDDLLVLNKAQGMVVHPAPGHATGTLVNALVYRYSGLAGEDPLRPGLVHRLDKDTSGVMVVAKSEAAMAGLVAQFQVHSVHRQYQVLVAGNPPESVRIETLHGRRPNARKLFSSRVEKGKVAISELKRITQFNGCAHCRVTLHTGRTHQVRVHCYDSGFPVLGDPLYSPRHLSLPLLGIHKTLPGQALHAAQLGFLHPLLKTEMQFNASPPSHFEAALAAMAEL